MERSLSLLIVVTIAGCGTPETRFLTCFPRPPAAEVASYKWHDPFPDEDAGPKMFIRPRNFLVPRSDAQKGFDKRYIQAAYGFPRTQTVWEMPATASGVSYPVQPVWQQPTSPPIAYSPTP